MTDSTPRFIPSTPTWAQVMPALLAAVSAGDAKAHDAACQEIMRLAQAMDAVNASGRRLNLDLDRLRDVLDDALDDALGVVRDFLEDDDHHAGLRPGLQETHHD